MGPLAIGSDGGGSVRIPSSFSGLFGMKASMGRVPLYPGTKDERYPGVSSWEALEHIGPMTRTVADGALMLSVIGRAGCPRPAARIPHERGFDWMESLKGSLKGKRIAYSPDWGYAAVDPRVRQIVGDAVKVFERRSRLHRRGSPSRLGQPLRRLLGHGHARETDLRGMRAMVRPPGREDDAAPGRHPAHRVDRRAVHRRDGGAQGG